METAASSARRKQVLNDIFPARWQDPAGQNLPALSPLSQQWDLQASYGFPLGQDGQPPALWRIRVMAMLKAPAGPEEHLFRDHQYLTQEASLCCSFCKGAEMPGLGKKCCRLPADVPSQL